MTKYRVTTTVDAIIEARHEWEAIAKARATFYEPNVVQFNVAVNVVRALSVLEEEESSNCCSSNPGANVGCCPSSL